MGRPRAVKSEGRQNRASSPDARVGGAAWGKYTLRSCGRESESRVLLKIASGVRTSYNSSRTPPLVRLSGSTVTRNEKGPGAVPGLFSSCLEWPSLPFLPAAVGRRMGFKGDTRSAYNATLPHRGGQRGDEEGASTRALSGREPVQTEEGEDTEQLDLSSSTIRSAGRPFRCRWSVRCAQRIAGG